MMANNYAKAFIEYCAGTPPEDIAQILNIPLETLNNKIMTESWRTLRNGLPARLQEVVVAPQGESQLQARAMLLQHNREENYKGWVELRSHALKLIEDLGKGQLKMKRYWHNRGVIVEHLCEPSLADLTAIANYYQIICNGSYLALGDRGAAEGNARGDTAGVAAHAPAITIVLPGAVSVPRDERVVVDIQAPAAEKAAEKPVVDAEIVG